MLQDDGGVNVLLPCFRQMCLFQIRHFTSYRYKLFHRFSWTPELLMHIVPSSFGSVFITFGRLDVICLSQVHGAALIMDKLMCRIMLSHESEGWMNHHKTESDCQSIRGRKTVSRARGRCSPPSHCLTTLNENRGTHYKYWLSRLLWLQALWDICQECFAFRSKVCPDIMCNRGGGRDLELSGSIVR